MLVISDFIASTSTPSSVINFIMAPNFENYTLYKTNSSIQQQLVKLFLFLSKYDKSWECELLHFRSCAVFFIVCSYLFKKCVIGILFAVSYIH